MISSGTRGTLTKQADAPRAQSRFAVSGIAWLLVLLPLFIRVALLPWYPPPEPDIHDEFVHILAADTLLHGRLANPPHPLWKHFDTIYEVQQPAYASKYPLGQAMFLAVGRVIAGEAWVGVWISCVLMVLSLYWAMKQWISPPWALAGTGIAAVRFCVGTYWMESYMGGTVAAIGGALIIGALGRMLNGHLTRPAIAIAAGLSVVWLTRPYEAVLLGIAVAAVVSFRYRNQLRRLIAPAGLTVAALLPAAGLTLLHNWRVTGNPLELPYSHSRQQYGVPTTFYFQPAPQPASFTHKVLRDKYEAQNRMHALGQSPRGFLRRSASKGFRFWQFFLGIGCTLPLLYVVRAWRESRLWILAGICAFVLAGELLYPYYFAHYSAVIAAAVLALQARGLQAFWQDRRYVLTAACVLLLAAETVLRTTGMFVESPLSRFRPLGRGQIAASLEHLGGKHIVFVRYGGGHDVRREWVYNGADIDTEPVIWAREMDAESNARFRMYYSDRSFWALEADASPPKLFRLPGS